MATRTLRPANGASMDHSHQQGARQGARKQLARLDRIAPFVMLRTHRAKELLDFRPALLQSPAAATA
jgi:hypothetical protein